MLGSKALKPVSIEHLLSLSDHQLLLTFETNGAQVRTMLQGELLKRRNIPAEEYNTLVADYHAKARKYLIDNIK